MAGKRTFEPPTLTEIGLVRDLTLQDKNFQASDGVTFQGIPIGPTAVS